MKQVIMTYLAIGALVLGGCLTTERYQEPPPVRYDPPVRSEVQRLTDRPDFEAAVRGSHTWAREALKTVAELERKLSLKGASTTFNYNK